MQLANGDVISLLFSTDTYLNDGLSFSGVVTDNKGEAREIIPWKR